MRRRKTTIGKGAFGHRVPEEQHHRQTLNRILSKGAPLTEDAVFLALALILRERNGSRVFQKVRTSKNLGIYQYFSFSPDIDLLEVRPSGTVVGYELKGYQRSKTMQPPTYYEGLDQAMAILKNPTGSPNSGSFAGSVFDYSYLVHPEGSGIDKIEDLIRLCTPVGVIIVNHTGTREIVKPKTNPFLDEGLKKLFLANLDSLSTYENNWKVNPVQ